MISAFSQYNFNVFSFFVSELYTESVNILSRTEPNNILEIGSLYGGASCYFSDFFMDNDESTLDCVDPFSSILTPPATDSDETTFLENISKSKNYSKITFHRKTSRDFFSTNTKKFNFILIDGSYNHDDVVLDLEDSFNALMDNGIMWINDYRSIFREVPVNNFLDTHGDQLTIIHLKYQIGIRKNPTTTDPTPTI